MKLRKKVKLPGFLISVLAIGILTGFALFSPPHSQSLQHSDAAKNVIKLFKSKPSKKQHNATPVSAQTLLAPSPSQTTTLPVIHKSGTLTTNETWTAGNVYVIDSAVTVPNGVTLTIDPGTIVKNGDGNTSIVVYAGGTFNVNGTSTNPIIFTSIRDDSVGGDSDTGGMSTGSTGDYNTAVDAEGGDVYITHSIIRYGWSALTKYQPGVANLTDNLLEGQVYLSGYTATLQRNEFDVPPNVGAALVAQNVPDVSGISLAGSNMNIFSGSGRSKAIQLSYSSVAQGKTWEVDPASNAVLWVGNLTVNGVLDLEPGTIVKNNGGNTSISVASGGVLNAAGTTANPVIFTSIRDDSAGGDTNNDGPSAGSVGDYNTAVSADGGNIYISNTIMQNVWVAFNKSNSGTAELMDNVFKGQVYLRNYPATLQRNQFDVPPSVGAALSVQYVSDLTDIVLSGNNMNTFIGSGRSRSVELLNNSIAPETGWQVSPATNAVLSVGNLTVNGALTLDPGVIVKNNGGNTSIFISSGGTLNGNGTGTSPVIFTSSHDDSAGGDTDSNGTSVGSRGDYNTAVEGRAGSTITMSNAVVGYASEAYILRGQANLNNATVGNVSLAFNIYDGEANLTNMNIDTAQTGLNVSGGAVVFRGVLNNISGKGIQACDWGSTTCSVDASYTDWGSTGPTLSLVCGQVTVAPWKSGSNTVNGGLFTSPNCGGSTPTPDMQLNAAATNYSDRMALKDIDCGNGFQDACDAIQTAQQCLGAATTLAASTSSFPLPNGNAYDQPAQWGGMLADNASTYIQSQEGEIPILSAASFATQLLGAVQTIMNVANAYNTCAP